MSFESKTHRTVYLLAALAVALGAFIFFVERGMLSSGELAGRRGRVFERFVRDRVTELVVEHQGAQMTLRRERAEDDELGAWVMVEPAPWPADSDAVDSLLGALEWADARRRLEGITADDRARFGFDEPRLSGRFVAAGQSSSFRVGGEDPQGAGFYLGIGEGDGDVAYVVGQDFVEALERDPDDFRDKELFARIGAGRAVGIRVADAAGARRVEKRDGRHWLVEPESSLASGRSFAAWTRAIGALTATRFVADAPADAFAEPALDLDLDLDLGDELRAVLAEYGVTEVAEAQIEGSEPVGRLHFVVGGSCGERSDERYARLADGPVVCIAASAIEALAPDLDALREPRLVTLSDEQLVKIELVQDGSRFELERGDGGSWSLRIDGGEPRSVDAGALASFMGDLRSVRAAQYLEADEASVSRLGLDAPTSTFTFHAGDGDPVEVLTLRVGAGGELHARRGEEPRILALGGDALARTRVHALRFRARGIIDEDATEATAIHIRRADRVEAAALEDDRWEVVEPVRAAADPSAVRAAVRELSSLEAVRFEADGSAPNHGLDAPRLTVELRFEVEDEAGDEAAHDHDHAAEDGHAERASLREYSLRIGASVSDGFLAQIDDDPAVFVVTAAVVEALERPLLGRGVLSTSVEQIEGLTIERAGLRMALRRDQDSWATEDGSSVDPEVSGRLGEAIATLRANRFVTYGAGPDDAHFSTPRAKIVITRTGEAPAPARQELLVGSEVIEDGEARVYLRSESFDAVFVVPAASLEPLLTYSP